MDRVGIIAAMKPEMDDILEHLEQCVEERICGITFYEGMIGSTNVVLVECGVGKVNSAMAATLLISNFECNLILNTGIAGGVGLKSEDVVVASSLKYHDFDTTHFGYKYGQVPGLPLEFVVPMDALISVKSILKKLEIPYVSCPVYSGDQFVSSFAQLANVDKVDSFACEMEGASIAQVCVRSGVDFIVLRYISDIIGEESQIEDYMKFESRMAKRSSEICIKLLNNL